MCGIVAAASTRDIVPVLIAGLKRLEYRGYDSAGLAVINPDLVRVRSVGRVAELERSADGLSGPTGIAHTRWATHGRPAEHNAHPHASGDVALVHNGIIENHDEIRASLKARGYVFLSETDTEVVVHLVHSLMQADAAGRTRTLFEALCEATKHLHGAYAIAAVSASEPGRIVGTRRGAPMVLGVGEGETFIASDASALIGATQRVVYLEEGDCVEATHAGYRILDAAGATVERPVRLSQLSADAVELGPYAHFMQKEIFEQAGALSATLEMVASAQSLAPNLFGADAEPIFRRTKAVLILACGTSYNAGCVARYWIEQLTGLPCTVEIASEYRYRDSVALPGTLVVTISQSGETADTLAALEHARAQGLVDSLTICNSPESAMIRQSTLRFLTRAGPEIGVASTKAFTTQLASLFVLALVLARINGRLAPQAEAELLQALRHLPAAVAKVLAIEPLILPWARAFADKHHALFLGRGIHYPIAMEGALKLKEITYIHAEAYAAGELKHGPLALVDADMPVVAVAPNDRLLEKLKSNLQEVRARGGELYVFADEGAQIAEADGLHVIRLTDHAGLLSPILHVIPLQLLSYHAALARGTDVDKPRNLAKSVTVE
jgi:glucosamine--fructose-6-phosphate aminotransferase (isomerizing)